MLRLIVLYSAAGNLLGALYLIQIFLNCLPAEQPVERRQLDPSQDNVTELKQRFETKNMKNNEAYVIM